MNKLETLHFMKKIKAYYQNFSIEEYIVDEWADKLKKYDINDVYQKLDQHLNGEYKNEIPKLHFITKYLKSADEKKDINDIYFKCARCNKNIALADHSNHVARHNAIDYIQSRCYLINREYNYEELLNIPQNEFDNLYDLFIEQIYEKVPDENEKQRLKNIILLKAGMPIETIDFSKQLNFLGGLNDKKI